MIHDVEHLFTYLHVIFISSLVRCLFRSFAHFKTGLLIFWLLIDVLSTVPPGKSLFFLAMPGGSEGKSICMQCRRPGFNPWVRKIPWRRKWQPTPVLLSGKSHGRKSLIGYSPRGCKESDMTERLRAAQQSTSTFKLLLKSGILHLQNRCI